MTQTTVICDEVRVDICSLCLRGEQPCVVVGKVKVEAMVDRLLERK